MVTDKIDINEFYWGVKTKFKLELGLKNKLTNQYAAGENSIYPDIVWFPQGTFIVTTFNTSITTNNCSISLSGKDKMCMLNGELGGQLFASIDFGTEETETKTMTEVKNLRSASSDIIMTNTYYKKLVEDEQHPNVYPADDIATNDDRYSFVVSETGSYYKNGNKYTKTLPSGLLSQKKYDIYKKVTNPQELFAQATPQDDDSFSGNYYYEKSANSDYYVLDTALHPTAGRQYYELLPLYEIEYSYNIVQIPLSKIIRESVHTYAKEPYHNIIINDLDDYGLEQLTYKGDKTLYALRNKETGHFTQLMIAGRNASLDACIQNAPDGFLFDPLTSETTNAVGTSVFLENRAFNLTSGDAEYTVAKFEYGDDLGYRLTDLVYTGDLISAIGDSLTSVLDKIKTMLGDFEYFYDLQGRFVFQRKRTYVNTSWSQLTETEDEKYVDYVNSDRKKFSFNFEGNRLVSAVQNSPVLTNLRNDFSVWGKRKGVSGTDIPIHARYAIDKKPVFYKALDGKVYTTDEQYAMEQLNISYENVPQLVYDAIQNFTMTERLPEELREYAPTKNANGSWSPGWWDIRDWARFYELLTDEAPNGTMKFYSRGDATGCLPISTLGGTYASAADTDCVWLIGIRNNGSIDTAHGRGAFGVYSRLCKYYTSTMENGQVVTTETDITKTFSYPYAGCNDRHTYLHFLSQIGQNPTDYAGVYFYNPDFPNISYEELVDNKIEQAYADWKEQNQIYIVDWREIIYQMALDYFAGQGCSEENPLHLYQIEYDENDEPQRIEYEMIDPDHFLYEVASRNQYYYPTGITGYEQYYTDMEGFWRQLYNPNYIPAVKYELGKYETQITQQENSVYFIKTKEWIDSQLDDFVIDYYVDKWSPEVRDQFNQLTALYNDALTAANGEETEQLSHLRKLVAKYNQYQVDSLATTEEAEERKKRLYWNTAVFEAPETLNFWIEFLDSGTELAQFSVPMVGDRSKTVNEDKAGAIIYKEIPDLILYDTFNTAGNGPDYSKLRGDIQDNSGYTFIYLPKGFAQYLTISYRNMSVKNKIDELLYQFAYCIENITITAIPIYYLEPNTRIYVQDQTTQINGEYIVSKITLPLTYNGTMQITATKAPERLY